MTRDTPAHGDVVIRPMGSGSSRSFAVSALPGPPQFTCRTLADAAHAARSYAAHAGVNVWVGEEGTPATLRMCFGAPAPAWIQSATTRAVRDGPPPRVRRG